MSFDYSNELLLEDIYCNYSGLWDIKYICQLIELYYHNSSKIRQGNRSDLATYHKPVYKQNNHQDKNIKAPVTLCRLGFPTRPDFEVGVCRGSVCLSRGELGIRRGRVGRVGIGREGTPTKYYM